MKNQERRKKDGNRSHRARGRGRRLFWAVVAVAGLLAVVLALPGFGRDRHDPIRDPAAKIEHVLDHMEASEEQRVAVSAVLAGFGAERERLAAETETLRAEMRQALAEPTLDAGRFETLEAEARSLASDAATLGIELSYEVGRVLTPQQRRELLERWSER